MELRNGPVARPTRLELERGFSPVSTGRDFVRHPGSGTIVRVYTGFGGGPGAVPGSGPGTGF